VSSVAPLGVVTIPSGDGRVNAAALDAAVRRIADAVNRLIAALAVMRRADNRLAERAVRLRALSEACKAEIASHIALLRDAHAAFGNGRGAAIPVADTTGATSADDIIPMYRPSGDVPPDYAASFPIADEQPIKATIRTRGVIHSIEIGDTPVASNITQRLFFASAPPTLPAGECAAVAWDDGQLVVNYKPAAAPPPPPPDPVGPQAIAYAPTVWQRNDDLDEVLINQDGTLAPPPYDPPGVGNPDVLYGYLFGSRRWVAFVMAYDYVGVPQRGIFMSNTADFPGSPARNPSGWALLEAWGGFDRTFDADLYATSSICQYYDGGVLAIGEAAGIPLLIRHIAPGGLVTTYIPNSPPSFLNSCRKIYCPRGGTRVFLATGGDSYVGNMAYSDDLVNWTVCSGYNTGYHGTASGIFRQSDSELIAFRSNVRYGAGSGSQDEVWSSSDNGASWSLLSRPWGLYTSGNAHFRVGSDPLFSNGRWWWRSYGDPLQLAMVSTSDWVNFQQTVFPYGRGITNWVFAPYGQSYLYACGMNPPISISDAPSLVRINTLGDAGSATYDDSFPMYPPNMGQTSANYGYQRLAIRDDRPWQYDIPPLSMAPPDPPPPPPPPPPPKDPGLPIQDVRVDIVRPTGSGMVTASCQFGGLTPAFGVGPTPDDSDPRFPYRPRIFTGTGVQFDIYGLRRLPHNYADAILDEFGAPVQDMYGGRIL